MGLLDKIFDANKKEVNNLSKLADKIIAKEDEYSNLTEEQLKNKTNEFRKIIENDKKANKHSSKILDDILVDAFAVAREGAFRSLGMKPYKVQIMGGLALHRGDIAEMRTGEGKTLTATMPVYLNALFWFGVGATWLIQNGVFGTNLAKSVDIKQLGFAFIGYLIFTLVMTVGSMETNKVLFIIFVLIDFLFIGLSLSTLGIAEHSMHLLAAYSELFISIFAFYGFAANVLNSHFNRVFLPLGKPFGIFKK